MNMYQEFRIGLMSIIEDLHQHPGYGAVIAEYIYANKFCNLLVRSIARKFQLEYEDLRSELVTEILEGKILKQVLENKRFNRQVFYLNIKKLALKLTMQKKVHVVLEEIEEMAVCNDELLEKQASKNAILRFRELSLVNLKRLVEYRSELEHSAVNISKFQSIVELNFNELLLMLDQGKISRYQLLSNPNKYRKYFLSILDKYLQLYFKYYDIRNIYPAHLKSKTGLLTLQDIYTRLKPDYSYPQFTRKIRHSTLWDIDEVENLLLKVTDHA